MGQATQIEEVIRAGVAIIVLMVLIYTFYTTPSPIQYYFQNSINSIILGIVIITILIVIIRFLINR